MSGGEHDDETLPGYGAQGASPIEHRFEGRPQPQRVVRGNEALSQAGTREISLNDPNPAPDPERRSKEMAAVRVKSSGRITFSEIRAVTEEREEKRGLLAFLSRLLGRG